VVHVLFILFVYKHVFILHTAFLLVSNTISILYILDDACFA